MGLAQTVEESNVHTQKPYKVETRSSFDRNEGGRHLRAHYPVTLRYLWRGPMLRLVQIGGRKGPNWTSELKAFHDLRSQM